MGTKPFTQKAVIDDCLDMLAFSTRNVKCDETALIDTGHSSSLIISRSKNFRTRPFRIIFCCPVI